MLAVVHIHTADCGTPVWYEIFTVRLHAYYKWPGITSVPLQVGSDQNITDDTVS